MTALLALCTTSATMANEYTRPVNVAYTFTGYCDGISLTQTGTFAVGEHTGSCEGSPFPNAGGFGVHINKIKDGLWAITTSEFSLPGYQVVFLLDEKALQWQVYLQDSLETLPFEEVNAGTLTIGQPPVQRGLKPAARLLK